MEADSAGPERPHQCEYCPKKYLRKNNLDDHILTEHPDSEKAFNIIEYKAKHGRSKGNLIIECDICSKRFRYQSDLKNHVESHYRGKGRTPRSGPVGGPSPPSFVGTMRGVSRGVISTPKAQNFSRSPTPSFTYVTVQPESQSQRAVTGPYSSPAPALVQTQSPVVVSYTPSPVVNYPPPPPPQSSVSYQTIAQHQPPPQPPPSQPVQPRQYRRSSGSVGHRQATSFQQKEQNTRTRPCLYCGKTFFSNDQLRIHEDLEASEFEKEALDFDCKNKGNNVVLEQQVPSQSHEIDRTDEEFGGWPPQQQHQQEYKVYSSADSRYISSTTSCVRPGQPRGGGAPASSVHYNHTSQYSSQDPVCPPPYSDVNQEPPPPAHEDATIVHGFLPPPPPLPVPQFSQPSLSIRHVAEYPVPNEEKIYTLLESSDQTQTTSSLISVDKTSSSLEVLDLSLPKQCDTKIILEKVEYESSLNIPSQSNVSETYNGQITNIVNNENDSDSLNVSSIDAKTSNDDNASNSNQTTDVVKKEEPTDLLPDTSENSTNISQCLTNGNTQQSVFETKVTVGEIKNENTQLVTASVPGQDDNIVVSSVRCDQSNLDNHIYIKEEPETKDGIVTFNYESCKAEPPVTKDGIVTFDAASVPNMQVNISYVAEPAVNPHTVSYHPDLNGSSHLPLADEYDGLMNNEEGMEWERSPSPLQFDDPNRLDCKFCGMIFDAAHVRKFHEAGHKDEHNEYHGDDTRLYCGWCGKTFKKVAYRMLHEKGHTGELAITCKNCGKGFRWESELKSHHNSCTAESPAKQRHVSKHVYNEDWIENHPSMPTGWKIRSRPRPNQEGQRFFIFLSPEGQVFYSRKSMLAHMEKTGGYSLEDLEKVRRSTKAALRSLENKNNEAKNDSSKGNDGHKSFDARYEGKRKYKLKNPRKQRIGANA